MRQQKAKKRTRVLIVDDHPAVREALATTIVDELYNHVDVTAQLKAALPKSAAVFAPTLASGIKTTSVQIASAALATSAVRTAWRQANRIAHSQIVRVLEGQGTVLTTAKGEVATTSINAEIRERWRATMYPMGTPISVAPHAASVASSSVLASGRYEC